MCCLVTTPVQVAVNGEVVRTFDIYLHPWLAFNGLGVKGTDVRTVTLSHTFNDEYEWIDILEVSVNKHDWRLYMSHLFWYVS